MNLHAFSGFSNVLVGACSPRGFPNTVWSLQEKSHSEYQKNKTRRVFFLFTKNTDRIDVAEEHASCSTATQILKKHQNSWSVRKLKSHTKHKKMIHETGRNNVFNRL